MLVCCWHTDYWVPARLAAIWPSWAGFEPVPHQAPGRCLLLYPNWGHRTQPLCRATGWLWPESAFSFTKACSFVPGTTNRISVWGAGGIKRSLLGGQILPKRIWRPGFSSLLDYLGHLLPDLSIYQLSYLGSNQHTPTG